MANIGISGKDLTTGKARPVLSTDVACDASGDPVGDHKVFLSARASVGASPIDWDHVVINEGTFVLAGGTTITFPSTGKYLIMTSLNGPVGAAMSASIVIGGTTFNTQTSNEDIGGNPSVSPSYLASITNTGTETLQITGGPFLGSGTFNTLSLQIIKLSN